MAPAQWLYHSDSLPFTSAPLGEANSPSSAPGLNGLVSFNLRSRPGGYGDQILRMPTSAIVALGQSTNLNLGICGGGNVAWYLRGTNVGGTNPTDGFYYSTAYLYLTNINYEMTGEYFAIATFNSFDIAYTRTSSVAVV